MIDKSPLLSKERYLGSDWGVTGPNCVTFTFDTLMEALNKVIEGEYSKELKMEARATKKKVKKVRSFAPARIKENLEDMMKKASK